MRRYDRRDYAGAAEELRALPRVIRESAPAAFFLGVSELLSGGVEEGVRALHRAAESGDETYAEAARFHLAKGLLLRGDVAGARAQLRQVEEGGGDYAAPARELREALQGRDVSR
jgi:hypothetical protein